MERRSFLKWITHGLGALWGVLLGAPAIAYLIDARNRPAPEGAFKTVARMSELEVGVPHQFVIRNPRRDAWTYFPSDVIGRVWLIKRDEKHVDAYTTICPHLGCSVNFENSARQFVCPCHGGTFDIHGKRVELTQAKNPAPRGMDLLEVQPDPSDPDLIQVKYRSFRQGEETPIEKI